MCSDGVWKPFSQLSPALQSLLSPWACLPAVCLPACLSVCLSAEGLPDTLNPDSLLGLCDPRVSRPNLVDLF